MNVLIAHNEYGRPSGEEHALGAISDMLMGHGHQVSWFLNSSSQIRSPLQKVQAFFSGVHSFQSRARMALALAKAHVDLVHVQNLFPRLSPSVLQACKEERVPVVMRCPNYRLFCPSALHLCQGQVCERCLGGREYWCVLRNCEGDLCKSLGYALRNAVARLTRGIVDNVELFIVLSEFQKQRFIRAGIPADRLEIVPNPAAPVNSAWREQLGTLVTYVGRASPEKGIADFVAAARALPGIPFVVAGSTERMPDLMARSPNNLRWLGFLAPTELAQVYDSSRILVLPSRCFEGFPNVVAAAMVRAKPVVAARLGGIPEIVEEGRTGLLFSPGDTEDLVEKIKTLYSDANLCRELGRAGRFKAVSVYSPEAVYIRLMEVYRKAVAHAV